MTSETKDIATTENYGRSKRASMLYSAGLVVLGFAATKASSVDVEWIGLDIPFYLAKIFTWLAAAYYTAIFVFEWRVARIVNSKAMANEAGGSVTTRLTEFAERFKHYSERISEAAGKYTSAMDSVRGNIGQFRAAVEEHDKNRYDAKNFPPNAITVYPAYDPKTLLVTPAATAQATDTQAARTLGYYGEMLKTDAQIVQSRAQENLNAIESVSTSLDALVSEFRTLSASFTIEQKIMFFLLDFGAVATLFLIGSVVAAFALRELIKPIIPNYPWFAGHNGMIWAPLTWEGYVLSVVVLIAAYATWAFRRGSKAKFYYGSAVLYFLVVAVIVAS